MAHRSSQKQPAAARQPGQVVVVGGGIAGLAAALTLAERGVKVTLLEREDQLGGRVASWPTVLEDGSVVTMSRGFHAFFRQYYTVRSLLRRVDPELSMLQPVSDYPLLAGDGSRDSFTGIPRTPPFNLLGFVAKSPSFTMRELAHVNVPEALRLVKVRFPETFSELDGVSAGDFLDRLRFPPKARHLSLEVFARSFFADPSEFSAGELVGMFHAYFVGSAEGLIFDVPVDDYDSCLWAPLGEYLAGLGVEVRLGEGVDGVSELGERLTVQLEGGDLDCDTVILAVDREPLRHLVGRAGWLGDEAWRSAVLETRDAPAFAVWRLWFDRPVRPDAPAFLGTSGRGPLDNISLLERFEAGAADWARTHDGSVVEVHAYAVGNCDEAALQAELLSELFKVYPELAEARVVDDRWLLRADCPLIGVEPWRSRPGVITPDPRVLLAGDGVRCELPVALMERAAVTGVQAANQILSAAGLSGETIWTVPTRGLLAPHTPSRLDS